jgi:CRISPR-associated protein Cas6/Cse3/CasE, subtype I-E/ECOLI
MSQPLHMIELRLNAERLICFAQEHGLNQARDEDLGYCVHAWLAAAFGELAPKPYRLFDPAGFGQHGKRGLCLLGYITHTAASLQDHARTFATPLTLSVCNLADLDHAKAMPAGWCPGRRLGFEVLACPVSRHENDEKDVFLRRVEAAGAEAPPLQRATVYADWLARQLTPTARLESMRLAGFRLVRMLRRTQPTDQQPYRPAPRITRPQALLEGELMVQDGAAFNDYLARGIGRHRAFGYGMLLLRPAQ